MRFHAECGSPAQVQDIADQTKKLESRFSNLVLCLKSEMLTNKSTVCMETFRHSIMLLPATVRSDHYQFINECSENIQKAGDIGDLFRHLNLYWTFLEYSLLSHIIDSHSDLLSEKLKQDMKNYEKDIEAFKSQTTVEKLRQVRGVCCIRREPPPGFSRIVTKLERKPAEYTLEELDQFRSRIAFEFNLPTFILMLESFDDGSLCITWHIPSMKVHKFMADFISLAVLKRVSDDLFYLNVDVSTISVGN